MKKILVAISLACLSNRELTNVVMAETTNDFSNAIVQAQASGDVKPIVSALPKAEKLWPQNPKGYFEFMRDAAHLIGATTSETNFNADPQLLIIFTSVLSKPISTNYQAVIDSLETQANTAWSCAGALERNSQKKADLLVLAQFMGKIQDQIISNYVDKAFLNPPGVMDRSPEKVRQAIEENKKNGITDEWQKSLRDNKRLLEFLLFGSYTDRSDTNFTEQIISAARLTNDEGKKMRAGARSPRG
jgi:hypothetical protein